MQLMRARVNIVDQQVIRSGERSAFQVTKSPAHAIKLVDIDAGDGIEISHGLNLGSRRLHHVRLLADQAHNAFRHVTREREYGAAGGAYENIRAGAARVRGDVPEHALAHTHQCEDHGHLNPNGDGTEQSSHRPVLEIF